MKEKESLKTIVFYELSEDDLNLIKRNERIKGRTEIINYIKFSLKYYPFKLNIAGTFNFINDLIAFLSNKNSFIQNVYKLSFNDFINNTEKGDFYESL